MVQPIEVTCKLLTFFNSIGMFKQTINYFDVMAVVRRGITFNQVKPISRVTNFQQFFTARGRTVKSLIGHVLDLGLVFLFSTGKINQQIKLIT